MATVSLAKIFGSLDSSSGMESMSNDGQKLMEEYMLLLNVFVVNPITY